MRVEKEYSGYTAYDNDDNKILSVSVYETTSYGKTKYEEEDFCTIYAIHFFNRGSELEESALIEIFKYIREEFEHYPGIDNHFSSLDNEEGRLIEKLITQGYIPYNLLLNTETSMMQSPDLSKEKTFKNLIDATTVQRVPGNKYSGYISYNSQEKSSYPRNFAKERLPQLLRQIATQLYHFCRSQGLDPVEIQIMHFNGSLFISANSKESIIKMVGALSTPSNLSKALSTPYSYKGSDSFDKKISARHATKLSARLYGDQHINDIRFAEVRKIITEFNQPLLVESHNFTSFKEGANIYFVCHKFKADRHAEENLMDILERFTEEIIDAKLKPAIFGKKRPCMSCHSRLDDVCRKLSEGFSLSSQPFDFNMRPGLLFKEAAYKQGKSGIGSTAMVDTLGAFSNDVYFSKEGGSGYATVSDSEFGDDEKDEDEIDQIINSMSFSGVSLDPEPKEPRHIKEDINTINKIESCGNSSNLSINQESSVSASIPLVFSESGNNYSSSAANTGSISKTKQLLGPNINNEDFSFSINRENLTWAAHRAVKLVVKPLVYAYKNARPIKRAFYELTNAIGREGFINGMQRSARTWCDLSESAHRLRG